MKKISVVLCACLAFSCFPFSAFAVDIFGKAPEGEVSVFDYGLRGMVGLGLFGGLSAGYVRYENEDDKGKEIGVSGAYGILAGAGLGLILGAVDASNGKKGIGALILRDMNTGGNFGALIGTICGGIKALNKDDSRFLGDGTAWGYLGGAILGVGIAFIESPRSSAKAELDQKFGSSVVFLQDSKNNPYPAFVAAYNF